MSDVVPYGGFFFDHSPVVRVSKLRVVNPCPSETLRAQARERCAISPALPED
jgi:hypothetical protein